MQHSVFISGAAQGIGAEIARLFHNHDYKKGPQPWLKPLATL